MNQHDDLDIIESETQDAFWTPLLSELRAEKDSLAESSARVKTAVEAGIRESSPWQEATNVVAFTARRYALVAAAAGLCIVSGLTGYILGGQNASNSGSTITPMANVQAGQPAFNSITPASLNSAIENSTEGQNVVVQRGVIDAPMRISKPMRIVAENG